MLFQQLVSLSALACLAAAVPLEHHQHQRLHHHPKREVVYETKVVQEYTTAIVTTTVHLQPGESAPTSGAQAPAGNGSPSGAPSQNEPVIHSTITSTSTSHIHLTRTVTVQRAQTNSQETPAASQTSMPAAAPTTQSAESQRTESQPAASQPTQTAPAASPTSSSSSSSSSSGSSSGSTGSGSKNTGDITYYTPGLGSCGITNSASDMIVALAEDMMLPEDGANPNNNPLCGRSITISYGGKTAQATIEDTCPGCAGASLDLTPSLFEIFAPLATGRVSGVEWWFN